MAVNANCQIVGSNHGPNQRQMQALQPLFSGDEIIAEPLMQGLLVALRQVYVDDRILHATGAASARDDMDKLYNQWSAQKQQTFNVLHNTKNTILDRWATNAFGITLPGPDGLEYHHLFLFNNISRANHSCQPNAVWAWDPQRSVGTLHALRTIQRND